MVHKVTMDTVKIITSSISGMTNVSHSPTQRAIALLKNSEVGVKVLRLPKRQTPDGQMVKQDADDYIKTWGLRHLRT